MAEPCGHSYKDKEGNWVRNLSDEQFAKDLAEGKLDHLLSPEKINEVNQAKVKKAQVSINRRGIESRAEKKGVEAPKKSEFETTKGIIENGKDLYDNGMDEKYILDKAEKNNALTQDEADAATYITRKLTQEADEAYDKDKNSEESKQAEERLKEWDEKVRNPHLSKVFNRRGMGLQDLKGEVDTDSPSGLKRSAKKKAGRDLTEKEEKEIEDKSKKSKKSGEEVEKLSAEMDEHITKKTKGVKSTIENPREHFSSKDSTDRNFTLEEVKTIWDIFKGHLDSSKNLHDAYKNTMAELGLTFDQIAHAIALPKTKGRNVETELLIAQGRRRRAINAAKKYVEDINASKTKKFFNKLWDLPQAIKIIGHGFTAPITHAALMIFRPLEIKSYVKFVKNTYKYGAGGAFSKDIRAEYEKTMMEMQLDPAYSIALDSGLAIDRGIDYSDDESINRYINLKERLKIGERGFDMLKPYRLEGFKRGYDKLTAEEKANPAILKQLARDINLGSGTLKLGKEYDMLQKPFWSFKLQAAKVAYTFLDPIDVTSNLLKSNWKELTPEEKYKNKLVLNRTGWLLASGFGSLMVNQAMLKAVGSNNNVNFSDPDKDDWLAYKVGGKSIPLLTNPSFIYKMLAASIKNHFNNNVSDANSKDLDILISQVRFKAHPTVGLIWDLKTGTNAIGQVNPFTKNKEAMSRITEDNPRMTWGEWVSQQGPIPIGEAVKGVTERMKEEGMSDKEIVGVFNNFMDYGSKSLKVTEDVSIGLTGLKVVDAKTNKRLFDNGAIPSRETQREIYKTGTQSERNYLDKNIADKINESISDLYDSEFEKLPNYKDKENKAAISSIKAIFKKGGEREKIIKTYDILPSEVDKYVETMLKQKVFDKKVEEGKISDEAKPYSEMSDSSVNEAFAGKLRDISNIQNLESKKIKVRKLIPLVQELYSLGKIDKKMINDFIILSVKGKYSIKEE
jgi:hypothetical protein